MTPEFKYAVISTNVDGDQSTAKFTNAKAAYMWAKRLQDEEIKFGIYTLPFLGGFNWNTKEVPIADLKKEAGPIRSPSKKRKYRR